ncbi:ketopantoate reductase family protein [Nitratifractor sp.]
MRVMILGTGGVGGYIGARLARHTEAELSFVARGEHLRAIRERGLEVVEDAERYTVHPAHATDVPSDLGLYDLILVTVKSTSLEESLEAIAPNVGKETVLLPILNGIDHDRTIRRHYPDADVLNGCIYILSNILAPGVVRKKGKIFKLCWGKKDFDPDRYREIVELFDAAKLFHKPTAGIDYEVWKKFLFISPMAALTSRYELPMDRVAAEHGDELLSMLRELLALAHARGIPLTEKDLKQTFERSGKSIPGAKTSMQLDLERGKPAEIDTLVGHVVREGERLDIPTPTYREVYRALLEKTARS